MSPELLRAVIKENNKTIIEVSAETKVSPNTIYRYFNGTKTNRVMLEALSRWVQEHSKELKAG